MFEKMKVIDVNSWSRKSQYDNFIKYPFPLISISSRLDVTELVKYCKEKDLKFFSVFLYILSKNLNKIEEFRTRVIDDKVVEFDVVNPNFIVLNYKKNILTCGTKYNQNFNIFYNDTRKEIETKRKCEDEKFNGNERADCFYVSCLQWIDIKAVVNPYDFNNKTQTSIPRITWGKYVENPFGGFDMGFDVSAHHALLDAFHVSELIHSIENDIKNIYEVLANER